MERMPDPPTRPSRPTFPLELKPILEAALAGDRQAQDQMKAAFDRLPEFALEVGDVARLARTTVMNLLGAQNPTLRDALVRTADELQTQLIRQGDSIMEHLLIERAVIAWLWVHFGDLQLADRLQNHPANGPLCRDAAQRLTLLQKVFENALKALALLRKLTTPRVTPLDLLHAGSREAAPPQRRVAPTNRLTLQHSSN